MPSEVCWPYLLVVDRTDMMSRSMGRSRLNAEEVSQSVRGCVTNLLLPSWYTMQYDLLPRKEDAQLYEAEDGIQYRR